jgi:PKD repeat protein
LDRKSILIAIILTTLPLLLIATFTTTQASSGNFEVLSTTFKSSVGADVYPGSKRASLRVDVRYVGGSSISAISGQIKDLPSGISPSYSSTSPARDLDGAVKASAQAGDVFYFEFYLDVDKSVSPGTYSATLVISFRNGTSQQLKEYYIVELVIAQYPQLDLVVVDASWSPSAYPGTTSTSLRVTIRNAGDCDLRNAIVKLRLPSGMSPEESTTQLGALARGDQATIQFNDIDVSESVRPGSYSATLYINGTAQTPDGVAYDASTSVSLTIEVKALTADLYVLRLFSTQWGETRPSPTYPGSKYVSLTITIINVGKYDVTSLRAKASSQHLEPVRSEQVYSTRIYSGDSCSPTFYFNVKENAPESFSVTVDLEYWIDLGGGTLVKISDSQSIQVFVERYVGTESEGLYVVSYGWLNNYNVFPHTDNATYQVTVANRLPFSVRGLKASLALPSGFRGDRGSIAIVYVNGPIQSYSTTTLSFRVSVDDMRPGAYKATLTLDYIVDSGGPGARRVEKYEVSLGVVNDSEALELVSATWLGSAAEPGTYGALLRVDVRNNYVDSMSGAVLELNLPKGFFSSIDNSSKVKVSPASPQALQMAQQAIPQNLQALISMIGSAASSPQAQQYSRGDVISFLVPLNVLVDSTGTYLAVGDVSYVDPWGCARKCQIEVPLVVLGSTKYLEVKFSGSLSAKNRYTNATMWLRNVGSSSIYNVMLTIKPAQSAVTTSALGATSTSLLIATPSTIYIDVLDPHSQMAVPVTFAFNPTGYQSVMGATTIMNYGVVPLTVSISYKDANGYSHNFDTTVTIALEPFIDIVVRDLKAEASGNVLEVSGTLINYGSATAYRVEVRVDAGNSSSSSFVGDVDPGSQTAFRVRVQASESLGDTAKLYVSYYNIFNERDARELPISITRVQPKVEEKPSGQAFPALYGIGLLTIILVAIFLVLVGLLIFRLYRSHMKKMRSEAAVQ